MKRGKRGRSARRGAGGVSGRRKGEGGRRARSAPTGAVAAREKRLATRLGGIEASPTLAMTARANQLKAQGVKVVSFAAGEPDLDTPDVGKEAAIEALRAGFTKYTPSGGISELKAAIVERTKRALGLVYTPAEIVVACGAKHALYLAAQALLDPGDEVIVPSPYWVTYPAQVVLAGARPVYVPCRQQDGWILSPKALAEAVTPRTRMVILNSPHNPTGAVIGEATLREIADLCVRRGIWILSDEIYEPMVYGGARHVSPASFSAETKARTIHVHGASKAYSMTGWRVGWAAGPKDVIAAMNDIASHSTSNVTSFAQKGAAAALRACDDFVARMRGVFERRRDLIVRLLQEVPGFQCPVPGGAFYVFPNVRGALGSRFASSSALAEHLLDAAHVATVPGEAFGAPGYIRLSYAVSEAEIEEGCRRIKAALA